MTDTVLDWRAEWSGSKVRVVVTADGVAQFVDACDPTSAVARKRLLTAFAAKYQAVDIAPIETRLLALAAEGPPIAASPAAGIVANDPDPWPSPVDGAELVRDIEARLRRYVLLPDHAGIACALWSLHTFCFREFAYSPRLFFTSGTKRSGKSVAASLVASLCSRPLSADNISAAAVYRVVEAASPTLACDEVDSWLVPKSGATESSEALRGVCNSGFARDGCVIRCAGEHSDPRRYSTFGPMILAGIGQLPDTLADRSITIRMMRRADAEQVERRPVGITARDENEDLVRRSRRWVADSLPAIRETVPTMPEIASDRARDVWFPLLALAEVAGSAVAERARVAAVALTAAVGDDSEDNRTRLLADLRDAFGNEQVVTTAALLTMLHSIVDAPWGQWSGGRPMSGYALSLSLRSFGVQPTRFRVGGVLVRGYTRADLANAWTRYLPKREEEGSFREPSQASRASQDPGPNVTGVTGVTGPGRGCAPSPTGAEIRADAMPELHRLVDEMTDGVTATPTAFPFTADDLRAHYRAMVQMRGPDATLADARRRRQALVEMRVEPLTAGWHP